jgi:glycosyltransferase involved in cell wall biosynthesis
MKLLTVTTLFPNAATPNHGVFVENRLHAWLAHADGEARVIAPVPWFPSTAPIFGRYARHSAAPSREKRRGIEIIHPRYFLPPKLGMNYAPSALARTILRAARALMAEGYDFDLIDAHYLYPDGVAALRVAQTLGKPVILTARGSDVTLLAAYPRQRAMILNAVLKADAVVAVAAALKDELVRLGAPAEKITTLRNGVDLDRFRPLDRHAIRHRLGLDGPVIASVGALIIRKGHDIALRAIAGMPQATLLIAGEGPEARALQSLARNLKIEDRVRFLGAVPHEELAEVYNAADALALASTREGWPNVLLEAMACGAPVVVSDVGGVREVVRSPDAGRIVAARTPEAFAAALRDVFGSADRGATRRYAEAHSWRATSEGLSAIYNGAVGRKTARSAMRYAAIPLRGAEKPRLLFTVDTEEKFHWRSFSASAHEVCRPDGVRRLQALCEARGVRPLYFLTYPVITDAENAGYFRMLAEKGRADLGLHLHQWNTPPLAGFEHEYYSWQGNLPANIHRAKLETLSAAFERAFGFRAGAHRAGRYGVTPEAYREIADIGVTHDFSPSPAFDFSTEGGPDFSMFGNDPFRVKTAIGAVFVTPVCGARAIRGGRRFLNQPAQIGLGAVTPARPRRMTAPLRLSCEHARLDELVALTRSLASAGARVLTFNLHSTTMTAGANPYAPDDAAVAASLDLIDRYLEFFTKDYGAAVALPELIALYSGESSAVAATRNAAKLTLTGH